MPDFSFPEWMTRTTSFGDSLLKGAQVGAIVANNRYRNQALAAQAIDAERNYALREKALTVEQEQNDVLMKSRMLELDTRRQLIEDQATDKEALASWISQRNKLPVEERLTAPLPNFRLPVSYQVANQITDNDRMAFQHTEKGRAEAAMDLAVRQIPPSYRLRYYNEPDAAARMQILTEGEEAAKTATLDLYQPREMTTSEGERVYFNPKTGNFRFAPSPIADEVVTRPITDGTGKVIGHAMRSGEKWVRIPEESISRSQELLMRSELSEVNDLLKNMEISAEDAAKRRTEIASKYTGPKPPNPATNRVRVKSPDGTIGTISADKLDDALKQGYQRVE